MEERLYDIFATYNPEMSSDEFFMHRLERNLEAVELVKSQLEHRRRMSRVAVVAAAITGFITGILATMCYPYLSQQIAEAAKTDTVMSSLITDYGSVIIWSAIALTTAVLSYTAYDITQLLVQKTPQPVSIHS